MFRSLRVARTLRRCGTGHCKSYAGTSLRRMLSSHSVERCVWNAHRRAYSAGIRQTVAALGSSKDKSASKTKTEYVCRECGMQFKQWHGMCPECEAWDSMDQQTVKKVEDAGGGGVGARIMAEIQSGQVYDPDTPISKGGKKKGRREWIASSGSSQSLKHIGQNRKPGGRRIVVDGVTGMEFGRVLGGGIVPGALTLVGGDPGVGKSTLLLQIVAILADSENKRHKLNPSDDSKPGPLLYVSAEETADQIFDRAERLGIVPSDNFHVMSENRLQTVIDEIVALRPRVVILDSIQAVYLAEVSGSSGGLVQLRECSTAMFHVAKSTKVPIIMIGHVTKSGEIAGPKILEHIVDVVLYLEGERHQHYRILRGLKNRFGATDEIGVFEMDSTGLHAVPNPSAMFLRDRTSATPGVGSSVAVLLEGTRPFLLEVQALCTPSEREQSPPQYFYTGVISQRCSLVLAILRKYLRVKAGNMNLHINVVGGMMMKEPAGDLSIAVALVSAYFDLPVAYDTAAVGELGLGGELRPVNQLSKRLSELGKLGFRKCVIAAGGSKRGPPPEIENLEVIQCTNVEEAMNAVFGREVLTKARQNRARRRNYRKGGFNEEFTEDTTEDSDVF